ncbi:hypothetical protein KJZ00_09765 [Cutibacterium avidum]|uniref:hypothetical protein n=1 Tax=Cutibacterium avidum TaxID=33010 RepID=UPI00209617F8|nr:hypothetical protein [Cutibacterium avidum]MCO6661020.1 hypothetical protein [Cutibacterium avidum]
MSTPNEPEQSNNKKPSMWARARERSRAEGLTMAECATVLGVTRGRVAQLAHG